MSSLVRSAKNSLLEKCSPARQERSTGSMWRGLSPNRRNKDRGAPARSRYGRESNAMSKMGLMQGMKPQGWSGPCSSKDNQFWKSLGAIAKKRGLEWGGDWKKRDVAHVQMKMVEARAVSSITA
ncbi:MAG: M15 family metallopeptidase [Pseudomonadota bacterium]